jgi:hypothetical protein
MLLLTVSTYIIVKKIGMSADSVDLKVYIANKYSALLHKIITSAHFCSVQQKISHAQTHVYLYVLVT